MSEVWLTHPGLTPAHDFKCLRAAIGTWSASGWQVREDQSDPVEDLPVDDNPVLPALSDADRARVTDPVLPAATPPPTDRATKKGS